jgi:ELWxxDGT repeat protein
LTWSATVARRRHHRRHHRQAGNLTVVGGELYFTADDGLHNSQVWETDGTIFGTQMVDTSIAPHALPSPANLTAVNGVLYFTADAGDGDGVQLWQSAGPAAGAAKVTNIGTPSSAYLNTIYLTNLTDVNGELDRQPLSQHSEVGQLRRRRQALLAAAVWCGAPECASILPTPSSADKPSPHAARNVSPRSAGSSITLTT